MSDSKTIHKNMAEMKYIEWLISGAKECEIRLATDDFMNCDFIVFHCDGQQFRFEVLGRRLFRNFESCVKCYGYNKLICDSKSFDDCVKTYKSFYPNKDYEHMKIVALKLEYWPIIYV